MLGTGEEVTVKADKVSFGEIVIDGKLWTDDIVIDKGHIAFRNKSVSRMSKGQYGHTPLTIHENIPWGCSTLVVGTGIYGSLPVTDEVYRMAEELNVTLVVKKLKEAVKHLNDPDTNFVFHLTC